MLRDNLGLNSLSDTDFEEDQVFYACFELSGEARTSHSLVVIEEVTPTSVTVSWARHDLQNDAAACPESARSTRLKCYGEGKPTEGTVSIELAAYSMWGTEPFSLSARNLSSIGEYTFENLEPDTRYRIRIWDSGSEDGNSSHSLAVENKSDAQILLCATMSASTKQERIFTFHPECKGPNLSLSSGNMTVRNNVNKKWNTVRATTSFSFGLHSWEVHVDR